MGNLLPSVKKQRYSGVELLRIIAMFAIMLGHSHYSFSSLPDSATISIHPIASFLDLFFRSITVIGVNIFIAISGWYGIKFRIEGFLKYIFQVFFISICTYCVMFACGMASFSKDAIMQTLTFYDGYWFVVGYMGLYIFSPLLNSFIEHSAKKEFQLLLFCIFLFQSYYSWLSSWYDYFGGYSIFLFMLIYLVSAYVRKYSPRLLSHNIEMKWIVLLLVQALVELIFLYYFDNAGRQFRYDNPISIATAVIAVMYSEHFRWSNRIINWLAASCFTVYLLHFNPLVYPYFRKITKYAYESSNDIYYVVFIFAILLGVYLISTLLDQIRITSWSLCCKKIFQRIKQS